MPSSEELTPPHPQNSSSNSESYRSPQYRKEVLTKIYQNTQALQGNINVKTIANLENIIAEVDVINEEGTVEEKIKEQGEIILDSEIMTISSKVLQKCSLSLSKNISSYDPNEFAEKLRTYTKKLSDHISDEPDWSLLGKEVMACFKKTATFSMILGTLRLMPRKEVNRRTRVAREAQAPTKRPENVIVLEKVEDSVEQTVRETYKIIGHYEKQNKKPLDFFQLVLHPTDFGKTIENILHVSFLVRDGFIQFILDEDGVPQVHRTGKDLAQTKTNKKKRNIQNVLSLNMNQWKKLVEVYNIERPMITINTKEAGKK